MTREEAIAELSVIWERLSHPEDCENGCYSFRDGDYLEALDMAIEALNDMAGRKDEPQTKLVNDSPILAKDLVDDEFNPYDEECMRCKHLKLQCEFVPTYCKYERR